MVRLKPGPISVTTCRRIIASRVMVIRWAVIPCGPLEPGEEDDESIDLIAPDAAGTYYYWACVDAVDGESNTDNNCSRGREVDVIVPEPMRPDLIVNLPRVDNDRVQAGSSIRVIFNIENQGDGHSGPTEVTAYLSDDRTITVHDEFVASVNIRDLEPSISLDWVRYNIIVPVAPGTYYYGACVDAVTGGVEHTQQLLGRESNRRHGA